MDPAWRPCPCSLVILSTLSAGQQARPTLSEEEEQCSRTQEVHWRTSQLERSQDSVE